MYPRFGTKKTDMGSEIGKKKEIIYLKLTITLAVFRCPCFAAIEKRDWLLLGLSLRSGMIMQKEQTD